MTFLLLPTALGIAMPACRQAGKPWFDELTMTGQTMYEWKARPAGQRPKHNAI